MTQKFLNLVSYETQKCIIWTSATTIRYLNWKQLKLKYKSDNAILLKLKRILNNSIRISDISLSVWWEISDNSEVVLGMGIIFEYSTMTLIAHAQTVSKYFRACERVRKAKPHRSSGSPNSEHWSVLQSQWPVTRKLRNCEQNSISAPPRIKFFIFSCPSVHVRQLETGEATNSSNIRVAQKQRPNHHQI